ncbi:hypothetical protein ACFLYL_04700 [Chloroflexota bacterium]
MPLTVLPLQPYVDLYGTTTIVVVGEEEIILELSAVNPITSSGIMIVQLTLQIPSGWSITSSGFAQGAGGLRTNTYEPGFPISSISDPTSNIFVLETNNISLPSDCQPD